jgi:hypothetical protein
MLKSVKTAASALLLALVGMGQAGAQGAGPAPDRPSSRPDRDLEVRPRGQREEPPIPPSDPYSTEEPDEDDDGPTDLASPTEPRERRL